MPGRRSYSYIPRVVLRNSNRLNFSFKFSAFANSRLHTNRTWGWDFSRGVEGGRFQEISIRFTHEMECGVHPGEHKCVSSDQAISSRTHGGVPSGARGRCGGVESSPVFSSRCKRLFVMKIQPFQPFNAVVLFVVVVAAVVVVSNGSPRPSDSNCSCTVVVQG